MSYTVTKYPQGTFSWTDVFSTDIAKTKTFMTKLMGWTSQDLPTTEGRPDYTMFYLGDKTVAGGSPAFMPNMPSFWSCYVTVYNLDEIVGHVEKLGGKITMPPMDVLDSGRMATIEDPTGANLSLWQPHKHIGAQIVNTAGAMSWNELYTPNLQKAKDFYSQLFGWTFETDENNYTMIQNNGRSNGGIFPIPPGMEEMPPNWTVYFTVNNVNQATTKAKELGGQICMEPKEISVGKIVMVADPTGATCMLIEMSNIPPSAWEE